VIGFEKEDHLIVNQTIQHPKKKKVHLSTKDIEELMGIHRDTYRKVNGAWRRK
jgi:hypothetical protein